MLEPVSGGNGGRGAPRASVAMTWASEVERRRRFPGRCRPKPAKLPRGESSRRFPLSDFCTALAVAPLPACLHGTRILRGHASTLRACQTSPHARSRMARAQHVRHPRTQGIPPLARAPEHPVVRRGGQFHALTRRGCARSRSTNTRSTPRCSRPYHTCTSPPFYTSGSSSPRGASRGRCALLPFLAHSATCMQELMIDGNSIRPARPSAGGLHGSLGARGE